MLLSAAVAATSALRTQTVVQAVSTTIQGLTPSEVKQAYGFNSITFAGGVTGDGTGQTIAIIEAYNDPNIVSDLNVFDKAFGLPSASLKIVNQSGGTSLPSTNPGWASETALDVEWAHAIAPGANILLVEAVNEDLSNLMAAVNYARKAAGVSVISMSWGGSETDSTWLTTASSESTYDAILKTPAGHQGVTFVAASGDEGSRFGADYPAVSPSVLSVGGTTLNTDSSGNYASESAWRDSTGGYSSTENEPAYQRSAQTSGNRGTPDVAYDGNPDTGFAVYDSVPDGGSSGWAEVAGTSAGAPQWAALVAIANQGRVLAGAGTLDGAKDTLPILYSLYSAPGTDGYATYTTYFNDVTTGSSSGGHGGRGGPAVSAGAGYDVITGLGTPKAAALVTTLVSSASSSGTSGNVTPDLLPIVGVFGTTPVSVFQGKAGTITLKLTNSGTTTFVGPVSVALSASTDGLVSADDILLTTASLKSVTLKAKASKTITIKFKYPSGVTDGGYFLVASISDPASAAVANAAATHKTITLQTPTVDLTSVFAGGAVTVKAGAKGTALVTVSNQGNTTASGLLNLALYSSSDQALDTSIDPALVTLKKKITLKAGKSTTIKVQFIAPSDLTAGSYFLIADATAATAPADTSLDNNVAVSSTR